MRVIKLRETKGFFCFSFNKRTEFVFAYINSGEWSANRPKTNGTMLFLSKQVGLPKISLILQKLKICQKPIGLQLYKEWDISMFFFILFWMLLNSSQGFCMALSMLYGIPQIISFKWYTICGPWVYSYCFKKYVVFQQKWKG